MVSIKIEENSFLYHRLFVILNSMFMQCVESYIPWKIEDNNKNQKESLRSKVESIWRLGYGYLVCSKTVELLNRFYIHVSRKFSIHYVPCLNFISVFSRFIYCIVIHYNTLSDPGFSNSNQLYKSSLYATL